MESQDDFHKSTLLESPSIIKNYLSLPVNKLNSKGGKSPRGSETNENRNLEECKLDFEEKAQPIEKDDSRNSRKLRENLWDYSEMNDGNNLRSLLEKEKGLDINSKLIDDWTALHLAANEGHSEIIEILIEYKANLEAETKMERRAIHIAALRGNLKVIQILIKSGAQINPRDKDSSTPLHFAAENGYLEVIRFLLENKADTKIKNYQGCLPSDICFNIECRKIFDEFNEEENNEKNYNGAIWNGEKFLSSSRRDQVMRLLRTTQESQPIVEDSSEKKQKDNNLKVSKIKIHDSSISMEIKTVEEKIGPQSFDYFKLLGKGSFGEVYLVRKKGTENLYAMKVLQKERIINQNLIRYAQTERDILSIMNHPFIVKLNFAFQNEKRLFLVMDYCAGGDLGKHLGRVKKVEEAVAKIYVSEVLLALEALHKNMIVFRDLKPDNVVLDDNGHALLTDFGLSKQGVLDSSRSFCGSVAYLAPEMLNRAGHNRTVDWYLLGVLLYELLVGVPPYYSSNRDQLFENIKKGPLMLPKQNMSDDAKSLIKQLLCRTPANRLGAKNDAEEIKQHVWFKGVNWNDVINRKLKPPPIDKAKITNVPMTLKANELELMESDRQHIDGWSFIEK